MTLFEKFVQWLSVRDPDEKIDHSGWDTCAVGLWNFENRVLPKWFDSSDLIHLADFPRELALDIGNAGNGHTEPNLTTMGALHAHALTYLNSPEGNHGKGLKHND